MYRFLLTPRWWGINVFVLLAVPFCVFMGTWQLDRFESRVEGHRDATARAAEDREADPSTARPLAELLPVDKETVGDQTTVTGRYAEQLLVPDRELDERRGYYVLTMLRADDGKALPVVRGWLPGDPDPAAVPAPPRGEVTVTGALQVSEVPGQDGVPAAGGLPEGQTGAISAASLVNLVPYEVHDAWVTLNEGDAGMAAVPPAAAPDSGLDLKAFQNLGYTGEWFVFAGFVVFMWFRLLRREVEFARDAELGILPEDTGDGTAPDDAARAARATPEDAAGAGEASDGAPGTRERRESAPAAPTAS